MSGFAEWFATESLLDEMETEMLIEQAVIDTFSMVSKAFKENQYDRKAPGKPVWQSPEIQKILDGPSEGEQGDSSSGYINTKKHEEDLNAISSSLKVLKADAVRKRAEKIKEIVRLAGSGSEVEAIPLLAELGYFGKTDDEGQNETVRKINYYLGSESEKDARTVSAEKRDKKAEIESRGRLKKALESAANEEGNDPPEGGFPAQEEVDLAKQRLSESLNRVMGNRLRSLAAKNQSRSGLGKGRVGYQQYEMDDLANGMVLGLLNRFTTRKWSGSGEDRVLRSWDYDDGALNRPSGSLFGYLVNTAKRQPQRTIRKGSPPPEFSIPNAPKKASVIRSDLKNNDFGFYIAYIRAAEENPLRSDNPDGKDRNPQEEIIHAKNDDVVRRSIMKDIETDVVDNNAPGMSLDPGKIRNTLEFYLKTKLAPHYRQVLPASQMSGEAESSEDSLLSGVWSDNRPVGPRGGGAAHRFPANTGRTNIGALFDSLKPFVTKAIDDIAHGYTLPKRPGGAKSGPKEALALCIKFGIPCEVTTKKERGNLVPAMVTPLGQGSLTMSDKLKDFFRHASERDGWSWEAVCRAAFKDYGINNVGGGLASIASKWSEYPLGSKEKLSPRSLKSMDEYLNGSPSGNEPSPGGLVKLCGRMEELIRF